MRRALAVSAVCLGLLGAGVARADSFPSGSLIIPMDIDYQDGGMLRAFGLLYQLLHAGVPVDWCIASSKAPYTGATAFPTNAAGAIDFTASATDVRTSGAITAHGYRGGPFVVDAANQSAALAIVTAFNKANCTMTCATGTVCRNLVIPGKTTAACVPIVTVHQASAPFTATISRQLVNAPNIGINADGNEAIAFGYLNAAGIPDSLGNAWSDVSPDVMTPQAIAGPCDSGSGTTCKYTNHANGTLFGPTGVPRYCQIMSMHWTVDRTASTDETVAEMRAFLQFPTHLFAECQAVNQIEDATSGHFVSTDNMTGEPTSSLACPKGNGACTGAQPSTYTYLNSQLPFTQLDGPFKSVGGSEPGYGVAAGSKYYDAGLVMIRNSTATTSGVDDLFMTSYANSANGGCLILGGEFGGVTSIGCNTLGKVSYLGGHQYTTATPISKNGSSLGTHLFLNSLFEAACTTIDGQPTISLTKSAPSTTSLPTVTFSIAYQNGGPGIAVGATLTDTLPSGATFVSATGGGTAKGGVVTWSLGDLASGASGTVSVTVTLGGYGSYSNQASVSFTVGANQHGVTSNTATTSYQPPPDMAMPIDLAGSPCAGKTCPPPANPCQRATCDLTTGACGAANVADDTPCDDANACTAGTVCKSGVCTAGSAVQCSPPSNPCQRATCDPVKGCVVGNASDGTACSTGNRCASGEVCTAGACGGGMSIQCPAAPTPCLAVTCDPASGCGFAPGNDGASCSTGDPCVNGSTCAGGLCQGGVGCAPSKAPCTVNVCTPGGCQTQFVAAGFDPNGDCAATGACTPLCDGQGGCTPTCVGPGVACTSAAQCSTGQCVDGYCCDGACAGQCQACNLPGHLGQCTTVTSGPPVGGRAACAGAGTACAGACDGSSATACGYPSTARACGGGSQCSGGVETDPMHCDGAGGCVAGTTTRTCAPYACGASACKTTCTVDGDCATGYVCASGACVMPMSDLAMSGGADSGSDGAAPADSAGPGGDDLLAGGGDAATGGDDAATGGDDALAAAVDLAGGGSTGGADMQRGTGASVGGCGCGVGGPGVGDGALALFVVAFLLRRRPRHLRARSSVR